MAGLDNIPQKQSIEIEQVKLDESILDEIQTLNAKSNQILLDFGQIYVRKKEISEELVRMDSLLEIGEAEFKEVNKKLSDIVDSLEDKYPQGRINIQDGTIQYQPGAPSRKQQAQRAQQTADGGMKVVKE
jgi:hypothetical protein